MCVFLHHWRGRVNLIRSNLLIQSPPVDELDPVAGVRRFKWRHSSNADARIQDTMRQSDPIPRSGQDFPAWLSRTANLQGVVAPQVLKYWNLAKGIT